MQVVMEEEDLVVAVVEPELLVKTHQVLLQVLLLQDPLEKVEMVEQVQEQQLIQPLLLELQDHVVL
tara:strand:+ start:367 stop:564 length:198 start_codon:yes stop_codon:yes gene_type:complete